MMEVIAVMWWWGPDNHMGAAGWVGMVFMILFWIAVVVAIAYFIRYLFSRPSAGEWRQPPQPGRPGGADAPQKPGALQILEERYAKGEIDREEFMQRRNDLLGKSG